MTPPHPNSNVVGRPSPASLLLDQIGYSVRDLWRGRIALIFTFFLPLIWLILIGMLAGNDAVDEVTGVRVMQFVTPTAIVMGVMFATFPPVAASLALARERKIVKRLSGTPLPTWTYLAGQVGGAVLLALSAVALMLVIGVVAYDVQIIGRTVLATVGTLVVGIAGLAALGLAVGALAPSAASGQTISVAAAVALSFISGMFVVGAQTPAWMETVASIFPIRHLVTGLQDQFNPFLSGPGWDPPGLAVIAAWALISLFAASWALRREPRPAKGTNKSEPSNVALPGLGASRPGRPRGIALAVDQTRWANRSAWRDAGWIFFAMAMPVGLYALMTTMYGSTFRPNDMPFAFFFACGMTAYGIAVTAFINMPEAVARARDSLVLKRLRGTPVTAFQYLTGRTASVVWIGLVTAVLVFGVAAAFFAARLDVAGIPSAVLVLLVGTLSLAACGYALVAVIPNAKSMGAVGLGILLPLSFLSDVFLIGGAPEWMGTIGSFFPLRHFVHGLATALDPAGTALPWANLAVLTAWLALAALIAIRRFRWEPAG